MSVVTRSEWRINFLNQTEKLVVAVSMEEVCKQYEGSTTPIDQITCTRRAIDVVGVLPLVPFITNVTGTGASAAGCVATPNSFSVEPGTEVIFQAVPVTGFSFVGWYRGGDLISNELIVEIAVDAPEIEGQTVEYEARFAPES